MNIKQNIIFNIATICSFFLLGLDYISTNINNSIYKIIFNVFTVIIVFIIIISLLRHLFLLFKKTLSIKYKKIKNNSYDITINNNSENTIYIHSIMCYDKSNEKEFIKNKDVVNDKDLPLINADFHILPYSSECVGVNIDNGKIAIITYLYKHENIKSRIKFFKIEIK